MSLDEHTEGTLSTLRLVLEPVEVRHADVLFDLLQDPTIYAYVPGEAPASAEALARRRALRYDGRRFRRQRTAPPLREPIDRRRPMPSR
jgi:hypothetical protein